MDNAFHLDLADLIQKSDATDIQGNIKGTPVQLCIINA